MFVQPKQKHNSDKMTIAPTAQANKVAGYAYNIGFAARLAGRWSNGHFIAINFIWAGQHH